jgi:hypothetical protein
MEKQIEKLMKTLNISRAEALEIIETDKRIDKGEKLFELDAELEAGAKKARQADRAKEPVKRERKADNDKGHLMAVIAEALTAEADSLEITNAEREINLVFNGRKFKVVLSAPRS